MSICKQVAKRPHLADDLYQEFFLTLLEIKDDRLIKANEEGYLEVLCVGVINNIWGKRDRVKTYVNGKTSPLHEAMDMAVRIERQRHDDQVESMINVIYEEHLSAESDEYDFNKDIDVIKAHHAIDTYKESSNVSDRFRARVFYYVETKYKNVRRFSAASGIPYRVCLTAYHAFKEKIKQDLCK